MIKDLDMRSSWSIQMGPQFNDRCPSKRKGYRQKSRRPVKTEVEMGVTFPELGNAWSPRSWKGRGQTLPQSLEECGPADTWLSDFWAPELSVNTFLLFHATKFGIICYSSHNQHIQ